MNLSSRDSSLASSVWAWLWVAVAGIAVPAIAMVTLVDASDPSSLARVGGPIWAVGLMAVGMIAAAASGRFWIGVGLALLGGLGFTLFAGALGMALAPHPLAIGLAFVVASVSFAARGALFARSAAEKGWWIAVFVVAGEAAVVATAAAAPGALPDWLLALLPAQWASTAIQTTLAGGDMAMGAFAARSVIIALAGTAAATLLVATLWPRRWPYSIMFTTWLALSALVLHRPGAPLPTADPEVGAAELCVSNCD